MSQLLVLKWFHVSNSNRFENALTQIIYTNPACIYTYIVAYRPLLSGDPVTATFSGKRLDKHVPTVTNTNATIEERCFLCGSRWYVIIRTVGAMNSVMISISQLAMA
jgi:hypothetical protein